MLPLSHPAARPAAASRSSRRGPRALRRACAVAAVALIPVLAGCEAGSNAPVLQWHPPTSGASATIKEATGELAIRNAFILGAPPNATLPAGSSAGLFVALVNTGPRDRLIRVSAPGSATSVPLPAGGVLLARNRSAFLTGPAPELLLTGLTRSLPGGTYVKVLLTFAEGGHGRPRRPGDREGQLVRHVLAGPDGVADARRDSEEQAPGPGQRHRDAFARRHRHRYCARLRPPRKSRCGGLEFSCPARTCSRARGR